MDFKAFGSGSSDSQCFVGVQCLNGFCNVFWLKFCVFVVALKVFSCF